MTPSQVKNYIRRAFREAVDRSPKRGADLPIWLHFGSACAYCGKKLEPGSKDAHIDHLVSASSGGSNHLGNRVLSCATCNESEKRDRDWEEFLATKAQEPSILAERRARIVAWRAKHAGTLEPDRELVDEADRLAAEVCAAFDTRMAALRARRDRSR